VAGKTLIRSEGKGSQKKALKNIKAVLQSLKKYGKKNEFQRSSSLIGGFGGEKAIKKALRNRPYKAGRRRREGLSTLERDEEREGEGPRGQATMFHIII